MILETESEAPFHFEVTKNPGPGLRVNLHPFVSSGRFGPWRKRKVALACYALARMSPVFLADEAVGVALTWAFREAARGTFPVLDLIRQFRERQGEGRFGPNRSHYLTMLCRGVFTVWLGNCLGMPLKGGMHCSDWAEWLSGGVPEGGKDEACDKLRCIFWDVPERAAPDPAWLSGNGQAALRIAEEIDATGRFEEMPVLADALEDGGCTDQDVLAHCRGRGVHAVGCGVLDLVLGRAEAAVSLADEVALYRKQLPFLTEEEVTAFTLHWGKSLLFEAAAGLIGSPAEDIEQHYSSFLRKQSSYFMDLLPW